MAYPHSAAARWFGSKKTEDAQVLSAWRDAPLTYASGQENGPEWNADHYEVVLGNDASGMLFRRAADLVLQNRFYPNDVMDVISDYVLAGRPVRESDRVLQRIHLLQVAGIPLLDVLTLNVVTEVIDEPSRAGFTYTTTAAHSEIGSWSPQVVWRENGEVALIIDVISRTQPGTAPYLQRFSRRMQLRAHGLSIANFQALLQGRRGEPREAFPAELLPAVLVTLALLFLGLFLGGYRRKSSRPRQH